MTDQAPTVDDLFTTYRARPVRAVQLTVDNIDALATLPGIRYSPETAKR
jgi:hypothetical protein